VDQSQPVTLASPLIDSSLPSGTSALGGSEAAELKQQVEQGNLHGLRQYLARTRAEHDWQDRIFILERVVSSIRFPALNFACDTEPQAADLFLIRCAFFTEQASKARGSGTCDEVGAGRFRNAAENLEEALAALQKVEQLDPADPTAFTIILTSLTIFSQTVPHQRYAFHKATELAPDLVPAYWAVVISLSERWHGSHQRSLELARYGMTKAGPGSDMAVCLFLAHMLVKTHLSYFDKKPEAANEYPRKSEIARELEAAFDSWTQPPYSPRRSSVPYLHVAAAWFYLAEDRDRLARALSLTNNIYDNTGWSWLEHRRQAYDRALLIAAGQNPPPIQKKEPWEDSLGVIAHGAKATEEGKFAEADKAFTIATGLAKSAPKEESAHIILLVILNLSLLLQKQRKPDQARKVREQGTVLLDADSDLTESAKYPRQTAEVLHKLGEFRRAIPFWEQTIDSAEQETDPAAMAAMLQKIGECYNHMGLRDHAAVPLRAALKIHRSSPGDPRLPGILISLGNALRKSSPDEAEACYKEAADLRVAKLQYESATPAWMNLGVLCSEQGRHNESLEHYERVLRVREQSSGTRPSQIAIVLNNMANTYRRMGKFPEAHTSVDRAIKLLPAEDPILANAYGTRALIFQDSGRDAKAVEWFRKARAERNKQPSPNLATMVEDLESEILSLNRMDRAKEVATVEETLASTLSKIQQIPQVDGGLTEVKGQIEGAVLIELAFDAKPIPSVRRLNTTHLAHKLSTEAKTNGVGRYRGWISVPESTTLIFYGPDAEALFAALHPLLKSDPVSAGARVTIRQSGSHREVVLTHHSTKLN
jgi:tetratricopeptide (TPR) repeat protein